MEWQFAQVPNFHIPYADYFTTSAPCQEFSSSFEFIIYGIDDQAEQLVCPRQRVGIRASP